MRIVKGRYRLPPQGFSVRVPDDSTGLLQGDPVTERGIRIALPSGGSISVYGEPNSLDYPTPADGVREMAAIYPACSAGTVAAARVGKAVGSGVRLACGERVIRLLLVFRPGGGPIYWLHLETQAAHEAADSALLEKVASSFRFIRWE